MSNEGVIKFRCEWTRSAPLAEEVIKELNLWRNEMHRLGLIGVNNEGIGYGNISMRLRNNTFIISGSGTGKFKTLTGEHYALVTDHDIKNNTIYSTGTTIASSESLTHAIIYDRSTDVNAVIHVHHLKLWKMLLETLPSTSQNIEYGTPEMANEIARLFNEENLLQNQIFGMAGHYEGVVCFGKDLNHAAGLLKRQLDIVKD